MWQTMVSNIHSEMIDLCKIVATSIENMAPSSVMHFEFEEARNMIMKSIMDLLKVNDDEVRQKVLSAL